MDDNGGQQQNVVRDIPQVLGGVEDGGGRRGHQLAVAAGDDGTVIQLDSHRRDPLLGAQPLLHLGKVLPRWQHHRPVLHPQVHGLHQHLEAVEGINFRRTPLVIGGGL